MFLKHKKNLIQLELVFTIQRVDRACRIFSKSKIFLSLENFTLFYLLLDDFFIDFL